MEDQGNARGTAAYTEMSWKIEGHRDPRNSPKKWGSGDGRETADVSVPRQ